MNQALRVLLVSDDVHARDVVVRELQSGIPLLHLEQVTEKRSFTEVLEAEPFDIVITAWQLGWADALAIRQAIKIRWPDCPVIIFTTVGEQGCAGEVGEVGRESSVFMWSFHPSLLPDAVHLVRERMWAGQALESEGRYQSLFQRVPVGLYRSTPEGQILDANSALVDMLGYADRASLLAVNAVDLYVDAEDRRREQWALERSEGAYHFETRMRRYDGAVIWVRDVVWPVRDTDGKLIYNDGSLEDITERKQAEDEIRRRTAQLEALREVGMDLVAELDLDVLLRSIAAQAVQLLGGTSGGLHLYQPDKDALKWTTVVGPNKPPAGIILRQGEGLAGRIWQTGKPLIVDDYRRWEGRAAAFDGYPWTAVVGVPVRWGDEFLGVLDIVAEPPRRFTAADAELLTLFAGQAAIAIRNARMLATAEEQRRRAEALVQATTSLTSTLERELLLENILNAAIRAIPAGEKGQILLIDEGTGQLRVHSMAGYKDPHLQKAGFVPGQSYSAQAVRTGRPLLISDACAGPVRYIGEHEETHGIQSAIIAPLTYCSRIIGSLTLENASRKEAFTQEDLCLLVAFADQAAVAVEHARLFEEVRQQKEQIRALAMRLAEAEEAERQWLARELHDQIGQNLTALGINLNIVCSQLSGQAAGAVYARLNDSLALVEQTTQRVRELMADLRPPVLDDYGLVAALRWYGEQFNARTDIPVVVHGDETVPRLVQPRVS